jgi:hypothetical protein
MSINKKMEDNWMIFNKSDTFSYSHSFNIDDSYIDSTNKKVEPTTIKREKIGEKQLLSLLNSFLIEKFGNKNTFYHSFPQKIISILKEYPLKDQGRFHVIQYIVNEVTQFLSADFFSDSIFMIQLLDILNEALSESMEDKKFISDWITNHSQDLVFFFINISPKK